MDVENQKNWIKIKLSYTQNVRLSKFTATQGGVLILNNTVDINKSH